MRKLFAGMLGMAACAALAPAAQAAQAAQAPATQGCGIMGNASVASSLYDPFKPAGLQVTNISMTLQRINGSGGEKTDTVNLYLTDDSGRSNGVQVIPRSTTVAGQVLGLGYDIFYDTGELPLPTVSPTTNNPSDTNRFLKIIFTGNNKDSDTAVVNFDVIVPAETSLKANNGQLAFTVKFGCSTTGGGQQTQQTGQLTDSVKFPIQVRSGLRATYSGAALDFGEIGNVETAAASSTKTLGGNYIRVESSGPYRVSWSSANAYRLLNQNYTAATAGTAEWIKYRLGFMGVSKNNASSNPGTQTCTSAGIGAFDNKLLMQAILEEGGKGKTPSGTRNYSDEITVTIEPLAYDAPAVLDCSAIALP